MKYFSLTRLLFVFLLSSFLAAPILAQNSGVLENIKVFGPSLEGNLEGDDPNRDVVVYLPPSYADNPERRYPVIYFLHGYLARAQNYVDLLGMPGAADDAIQSGLKEMIIVFPDAYTIYGGSMFSNSPTTGDWEAYVATDLVSYIDENYRTISERSSRGLSGHSMGGYGTLRIGMKHPEVFGALYAMSSCCLLNQSPDAATVAAQNESAGDAGPAAGFANAPKAQAAAWAPNPNNPPLYFDWPYDEDGEPRPIVQARWSANSPVVMVGQYVPALRSYNGAIKMDVGDSDPLGAATSILHEELDRLDVEHSYELYEGDHMSHVAPRFIGLALPFFSEWLQ